MNLRRVVGTNVTVHHLSGFTFKSFLAVRSKRSRASEVLCVARASEDSGRAKIGKSQKGEGEGGGSFYKHCSRILLRLY